MIRKNIVLIGFMGSGKSSIGRLVARVLGYRYVDIDRLIIEQAGMEIQEIFALHGEEHFRELETGVLETLQARGGCVIATGGGVILRARNRELLQALGWVVCLSASEDVIFERVSRNGKRPLLQTENPRETVHNLLESRRPFYAEVAQITVDTSRLSHEQVVEEILAHPEIKSSCPPLL